MAETPDIWAHGWPGAPKPSSSGPTPVRPIGGRTPRFGVAHELDQPGRPGVDARTRADTPWPVLPLPPGSARREARKSGLRSWWACRETGPADLLHRMRCRRGRHQIEGGQQIQLGGRFVNTERRCVWCGHKPY